MFFSKKFLQTSSLLVGTILLFVGCSSNNNGGQGGSQIKEPTSLVKIDKVEVSTRGSSPAQVIAKVSGTLKNNCEKVSDIQQKLEGDTFKVSIGSKTQGEDCGTKTVFFQRNIGLNVADVKAGKYTVEVNGIKETFEFTKDV